MTGCWRMSGVKRHSPLRASGREILRCAQDDNDSGVILSAAKNPPFSRPSLGKISPRINTNEREGGEGFVTHRSYSCLFASIRGRFFCGKGREILRCAQDDNDSGVILSAAKNPPFSRPGLGKISPRINTNEREGRESFVSGRSYSRLFAFTRVQLFCWQRREILRCAQDDIGAVILSAAKNPPLLVKGSGAAWI